MQFDLTSQSLLISPFLIALNSGLKVIGMPSKYAILVNWFGGLILNIVLNIPTLNNPTDYATYAVVGFLLGSSAGGIYDIKKFLGK